MDRKSNYVSRKFGFHRILWEIKNYCITSNILEWKFDSSEFDIRGFHLTKWKMSLARSHVSGKNFTVLFYLQRLECKPYSEETWIDCVLEYSDHYGQPVEIGFESYFKVNDTFSKKLTYAGVTPVNAFHTDVFELKCEILIQFSDIIETIPSCENIGIRRLSEDLHNLYECGVHHNLELQHVNNSIYAHKAVLFHRITDQAFKSLITQDAEVVINVEDFSLEAVDTVVRFLYTGNIEHAVTLPFISVFKFAEFLDVKPIIAYYDPDEIAMTTTIGVEEYCETWTIENFYNRRENFLVSPVMTNKTMDMKWRLKVYPKGFGKKGKFVGIFLEIESKTPKETCIEFFVKDDLENRISYRYHNRVISKEIFGDRNFIEMDNMKNYMRNDSLTIGLRLRMPSDEDNISVGESIASYEHSSIQKNYDQLSKDILCLYQDRSFHDMCIEFLDHNIIIYAHDCILNERCSNLVIECKKKNLFLFNGLNFIVIKELFSFLYSGKLNEDIDLEDIFCLYQIANNFNIRTLQYAVAERLSMSLNESNVRSIYEFANSENTKRLRDSA